MIIKRIKLENIKSYSSEEINFTNGINFILGTNGSGKTTIIESIGLALFNFSKGTQGNLLRYNKTKGSIEIDFIANDGIEYRVIRTIRPKSAGTVKLIDISGNTELYSGVGEVYSYIKNVLKIVKTKDFPKMFEEIIAVPQGQYVAAFLERPSIRKENFDRLFDLHIYKNLNNKLNSIASNIKDNKISVLKEAIATINGEVKRYDEVKAVLAEVIKQIKELTKEQEKLEKKITAILVEKQKLEKIKEDIANIKNETIIIEENIKNLIQLIKINNEELLLVKKAQAIVEKNKKEYIKYQENAEKIAKYEQKYSQYLDIESNLINKENEVTIIQNNIKNLKDNFANKEQDLIENNKEILRLNTESMFLISKIEKLKNSYEKRLKETNQELDKIGENEKHIKKQLDALSIYQTRYEERLIKDWHPYENIDKRILDVNKEIKKINIAKDKLEIADKQRTKLAVELDNAIANSQISRDGNCPFFKEKCKNIDEQSLTDYFNKIIIEKRKAIEDIDVLIHKYKQETDSERKHISELQTLETNKKELSNYQLSMEKLENDFFDEFDSDIEKRKDLNLGDYIQTLQEKLSNNLNILNVDEEKINQIKAELVNENTHINGLEFENKQNIRNIESFEKNKAKLTEEIEAISKSIVNANKSRSDLNKEIGNIKESILEVADSKKTLDNLKEENAQLEEFRNQYLSNISKAKEVDKIVEIINRNQLQIDEYKNKLEQLKANAIGLQNEYSEDTFQEKTKIYMELLEIKGSIISSVSEKGVQRNNLQNEVYEMDILFKERDTKQIELDRFNNINEFINRSKKIFIDLPRELSVKYREHISNVATRIYRQISRERVQLELTEDYGVVIIEDDNPKNQKTIDVLSGGEQMSVAIAIRLSMLKGLTGLDIYFLDEPTVNLDQERRENVADVVGEIADDLSQLFVISHDDTFDQITDTVIKIVKENNESRLG